MVPRRSLLKAALVLPISVKFGTRSGRSQESGAYSYSYPLGLPGRPLGDGFVIRHTFTSENTWYLPNYWHTGED